MDDEILKNNKVIHFASTMEEELEHNSHKGNWEDFTNENEIKSELYIHLDKLELALINSDLISIREHIADCANILMFLGNSKNLY